MENVKESLWNLGKNAINASVSILKQQAKVVGQKILTTATSVTQVTMSNVQYVGQLAYHYGGSAISSTITTYQMTKTFLSGAKRIASIANKNKTTGKPRIVNPFDHADASVEEMKMGVMLPLQSPSVNQETWDTFKYAMNESAKFALQAVTLNGVQYLIGATQAYLLNDANAEITTHQREINLMLSALSAITTVVTYSTYYRIARNMPFIYGALTGKLSQHQPNAMHQHDAKDLVTNVTVANLVSIVRYLFSEKAIDYTSSFLPPPLDMAYRFGAKSLYSGLTIIEYRASNLDATNRNALQTKNNAYAFGLGVAFQVTLNIPYQLIASQLGENDFLYVALFNPIFMWFVMQVMSQKEPLPGQHEGNDYFYFYHKKIDETLHDIYFTVKDFFTTETEAYQLMVDFKNGISKYPPYIGLTYLLLNKSERALKTYLSQPLLINYFKTNGKALHDANTQLKAVRDSTLTSGANTTLTTLGVAQNNSSIQFLSLIKSEPGRAILEYFAELLKVGDECLKEWQEQQKEESLKKTSKSSHGAIMPRIIMNYEQNKIVHYEWEEIKRFFTAVKKTVNEAVNSYLEKQSNLYVVPAISSASALGSHDLDVWLSASESAKVMPDQKNEDGKAEQKMEAISERKNLLDEFIDVGLIVQNKSNVAPSSPLTEEEGWFDLSGETKKPQENKMAKMEDDSTSVNNNTQSNVVNESMESKGEKKDSQVTTSSNLFSPASMIIDEYEPESIKQTVSPPPPKQ